MYIHELFSMPCALLVCTGIVRLPPKSPSAFPQPHVISIGGKMREVVSGVPLSLAVNLENATCHAVMTQSTRLVNYYCTIYMINLHYMYVMFCNCIYVCTYFHMCIHIDVLHTPTHPHTHTHPPTHTHTHTHTHSMSLVLRTSHCLLKNKTLEVDTNELDVVFDKHKIVTLESLKAVFPRGDGVGEIERRKIKQMELETNPAM